MKHVSCRSCGSSNDTQEVQVEPKKFQWNISSSFKSWQTSWRKACISKKIKLKILPSEASLKPSWVPMETFLEVPKMLKVDRVTTSTIVSRDVTVSRGHGGKIGRWHDMSSNSTSESRYYSERSELNVRIRYSINHEWLSKRLTMLWRDTPNIFELVMRCTCWKKKIKEGVSFCSWWLNSPEFVNMIKLYVEYFGGEHTRETKSR